jgi:transposase-like protein
MQRATIERRHKTPAERAEILAAFQQTELSSHRFARQYGIAASTLFRWLRQAAAPSASDPGAWIEVPNLLGRQLPAPAYRLRFANGVSVEVGSGFQPDELRALAQLVRGL